MEDQAIEIYVKRDEHGSIIGITSSVFITLLDGWERIDEWTDIEERYLYSHAGNGEYVIKKHGYPLYDDQGRPNFHDDFVLWTDAEKESLYPISQVTPSEQEQFNAMVLLELAKIKSKEVAA